MLYEYEELRWQGKGGTAENHWNGRHWEKNLSVSTIRFLSQSAHSYNFQ